MIDGLEHMEQVNSEMEKYKRKMHEEQKEFSFVQLDFLVNMEEAQEKYQKEYKDDVNGIRTSMLSFTQWLDYKKYQAAKFYMKHSDFFLEI